ncbi:hypothetical protein HBHAL_4831 [Halobacillus halophilus DSM 2266]|uniref:Secreted protein n=1 Tax=Halobacillus halophilus (strain ATCC 35676 / DSM 2266 / JCM 20832 / KCTC 3685 / LMG 17431 / NBRC 102448 / NCIMB 2269) TaxID=866895 RepID=I0JSP7_HALH3|nr:hypothetical protein [Halobacillus halophilus]CCG47169.1 hypothetical protein HBHAL_4831 [Halobacillus halophilus DSM 2266]
MKKLIAFIAVVGLAVSIVAPLNHDSAVETHPRPNSFEYVS